MIKQWHRNQRGHACPSPAISITQLNKEGLEHPELTLALLSAGVRLETSAELFQPELFYVYGPYIMLSPMVRFY